MSKPYKAVLTVTGLSGSSPAEAAGFFEELMLAYLDGAKYPPLIITDSEGNITSHYIGLDEDNEETK